jgi:hypothetical protein
MRREAGRADSQDCTMLYLSFAEIIASGCCCIKLILLASCVALLFQGVCTGMRITF